MSRIRTQSGEFYQIKITDYGTEKKITFYSKPIERGARYENNEKNSVDWNEFDNDLKSIGWLAPEAYTSPFPLDKFWDLDDPDEIDAFKRNLNRAKNMVYDLARANKWEWFATFTFSKDKIDRYDYDNIRKKFFKFLNNYKERCAPDLKYVIIPEQHEDLAIHFHALMSNIRTDDLVLIKGKRKKYLNLIQFYDKFGFSVFDPIRSSEAASNYVTKYITKHQFQNKKYQKRFYVTQNLNRPTVTYTEDTDIVKFLEEQAQHLDLLYIKTKRWGEMDINWIEMKSKEK